MNLGESVIVFEILLLLPVRSLLRFRCVCKDWCMLINSCVFKDTYLALRRAMAVDDQLVGFKTTLVSDIPFEEMDRVIRSEDSDDEEMRTFKKDLGRGIYSISGTCWSNDYQSLALSAMAPSSSCNDFEISGNCCVLFRIIDHVDGIVCFFNGDNWFDIFLVNPALRELKKLSNPLFDLGGFKCDSQAIGFGFDDSSNEYKVVAIVIVFEKEDGYNSPYKHIGIVYHLSTNSWKILGDMSEFVSRPFVCFSYEESVFSHGSIHWCLQSDVEPQYKYRILAFDVTNELFREIPFPNGYRYYAPYQQDAMVPRLFTIDKSTVALVSSTVMTCDVQVLDVWVMKEYGDRDSWTKLYSISNLPAFTEAMTFWKIDKLLLRSRGGELICYDLFKGQLDEHEQCYPISMSGIRGLILVTGHESLVSVKQL